MDHDNPTIEPAPAASEEAQEEYLRWPPPGLESLHGRLFPAVTLLGVADIILVVPIVLTVIADPGVSGVGLWGAWWFAAAAALIGLLLAFLGFDRLYHMLRNGARAAQLGHSLATMLAVAADSARDTGFVLQGTRIFRQASQPQRERIMRARVLQGIGYLFAAVWAPVMLAVAIVTASRGLMSRTTMLALVALVPLLAFAGAVVISIGEMMAIRRIDRRKNREWGTPQDLARVKGWYEHAATVTGRKETPADAGLAGRLRIAYVVLGVLAILMAAPIVAVSVAGAVGPIVASIAIPNYANIGGRIATANVLRRYRLPPDSTISAAAAGQALQALLAVGESQDTTGMLAPVRSYDSPWFPADSTRVSRYELQDSVVALLATARRIGVEEMRYLDRLAGNPALVEWRTSARAGAADIMGTRYVLPFSQEVRDQPYALPIPMYRGLRDGARAQILAAAAELARNRADRAEVMVREVLSTGFLMVDESPILIDNLIGASLVSFAGDALAALYRETGRTGEAEAIDWMVAQAADLSAPRPYRDIALEDTLDDLMSLVQDDAAVRGLRWDSFVLVNSLAPCMNTSRIVFGSGGALVHWREQARSSLARYQGEGELFDLYRNGFFGGLVTQRGIVPRFFGAVFGSRTGANECINALAAL